MRKSEFTGAQIAFVLLGQSEEGTKIEGEAPAGGIVLHRIEAIGRRITACDPDHQILALQTSPGLRKTLDHLMGTCHGVYKGLYEK